MLDEEAALKRKSIIRVNIRFEGIEIQLYMDSVLKRRGSFSPTSVKKPKLERKFSRIADGFTSLQQVTEELTKSGLESSNLIVGIDFTKSNEWTGKNSFHGSSLHHVGTTKNPYEQAISIIGRTLSSFDEDNLIPCFGFGDGKHTCILLNQNNILTFLDDIILGVK
ncbi:E3 ubiquitin-protein ligase RGLG2-like [Zingiber officinale]|uniref:E3 ubiquitin-protein ligase RGLG2-like n=1 Tax=Zingiber officinale TaxID=94328 RepID=UPI001C4B6CAA|nr:E3 ubiquitin-protein ligase RGLG2-like [Zingiber officinale]